MSYVLNMDPLRALAERAADRIGDPALAKRFERIAVNHLLRDGRNFRDATEADLKQAPEWARQAAADGEKLRIYKNNTALAARLHTVARRVASARKVAATDPRTRPEGVTAINAAQEFLAKFGRVNFDTAARKSLTFSRVLVAWQESDDLRPVCPPQSLVLLAGFVWHRITSVAELRRIGREFHNCLARSTDTSAYGGQLAQGRAQFWVLRDMNGAGLIVAMAPAPRATQFAEVKGPNNAPIRPDNPQLLQLGIALGVHPRTPEPPRPPPPASSARALAPSICRCSLCDPALWQRLRLANTGP